MRLRTALLRRGIGPSVLTLACASALAAVPPPSGYSAQTLPGLSGAGESAAIEPRVVVVDPRHPEIRIELPAAEVQAAGEDMQGLYRKLVRTAGAASATLAVAENGRVFFRRAETTALAKADTPPLPELPAPPTLRLAQQLVSVTETQSVPEPLSEADPITLRLGDQLAAAPIDMSAVPSSPPRRAWRKAEQARLELPEEITVALGWMEERNEREPEAPSLFAAQLEFAPTDSCTALLLSEAEITRFPAQAASHSTDALVRVTRPVRVADPSRASIVEIVPQRMSGRIALASLDEAGEWLVYQAIRIAR